MNRDQNAPYIDRFVCVSGALQLATDLAMVVRHHLWMVCKTKAGVVNGRQAAGIDMYLAGQIELAECSHGCEHLQGPNGRRRGLHVPAVDQWARLNLQLHVRWPLHLLLTPEVSTLPSPLIAITPCVPRQNASVFRLLLSEVGALPWRRSGILHEMCFGMPGYVVRGKLQVGPRPAPPPPPPPRPGSSWS